MNKHVKARISALGLLIFALTTTAQAEITAAQILKKARSGQAENYQTLRGRLRTGSAVTPFRLVMNGNEIRYEFSDPDQTLRLRLTDNTSRLEEITAGETKRITPARFDAKVRQTIISYEDLSLRFLYWPNAKIEREETLMTRKCWMLRMQPESAKESQYGTMFLWIDQQSGALMQADGYDWNGKLNKRFKVVSTKKMRIEQMHEGKPREKTPTYLEIEGSENAKS